MKMFNKIHMLIIFLFSISFGFIGSTTLAATTPSLWDAASFGILSSTYTNIAAGVINWDVWYTTAPVVAPIVNGGIFMPSPSQAGSDQNNALINLNGQWCTFTFAAGITDLVADTTHNPLLPPGIYEPWVYCTVGAASTAGPSTWLSDGLLFFAVQHSFMVLCFGLVLSRKVKFPLSFQ